MTKRKVGTRFFETVIKNSYIIRNSATVHLDKYEAFSI